MVVADVTDNPGSGHYGDTPDLLRAVLNCPSLQRTGPMVFYAIYDPVAVKDAIRLGVGNVGDITVGGKFDPTIGGAPLVVHLSYNSYYLYNNDVIVITIKYYYDYLL